MIAAHRLPIALGLAALLAMTLLVGRAAAAPGSTASARAVAREHFARAETEFAAGRYGEALVEYQAAYDAVPEPSLLFNIAQCHRALAQYRPAIEALRAYLAARDDTAAATGRMGSVCVAKACIEALIDELSRRDRSQGSLGDELSRRDRSQGSLGDELSRRDRAQAPAPDLRPSHVAVDAQPSPVEVAVRASPPPRRRPIYKRWWFITGAVAVVAAGAVGGYFALRGDRCGGAEYCYVR